jgi:Tfp pilus assembly protein PilX
MNGNARGSALVLALIVLLCVVLLTSSLLAVVAARTAAVTRDSRIVQATALAESAIAVVQADLQNGKTASAVYGTLATGSYRATIATPAGSRLGIIAEGTAMPMVGRPVVVKIRAALVHSGSRWTIADWQELQP